MIDGRIPALLATADPEVLGLKMGLRPSTIYSWQTGARLPYRKFLRVLAAAIDVPFEDVFAAWASDRKGRRKGPAF